MGQPWLEEMMAMDVFEKIIEDHREFLKTIDEMRGRNTTRRSDQMRNLTTNLRAHMRAEEQTIYEQLKSESQELKGLALIQYESHHVFEILLEELQNTDMDNDIWNAKLSVFGQYLELHVGLEENSILPTAKEFFPDEQLERMASDFEAIKENILLRR